MKYTVKILLYLLIFGTVPLISFLLITSRSSLLFGLRTFVVMTGSMEPAIGVDDLIFTIPARSYHIGDVITFQRGDKSITHRIINIKNNQYEVKGDANNGADPILVSKNAIIGKAFLKTLHVGKVTSFIKTFPGFFLSIVIPTTIFIIFEIKTIKEEWEKEVEKKLTRKFGLSSLS